MANEDDLVLVALVVSLVALLIAVGQALQQYLATADGYRRCSPAVMGSWAALRYRRWVWSEFRFETIYVAPHITMGSDEHVVDEDHRLRLIDFGHVKHRTKVSSHQREILQISVHRGRGPEEELAASWLILLRQLHDLYMSYWPGSCSTCLQIPKTASEGLLSQITPKGSVQVAPTSIPVVVFKTWTWDFMPPDLTRPPATSTLSDIVLVGLRFGMNWRLLDPGKGLLAADGGGFSLLAMESQGLGLVVRFSASRPLRKFSGNIPTHAADKMFFGIVAGDPLFVKQDYDTVPDKPMGDGRLIDQGPPGDILISIGVPNSTCHKIWHMGGVSEFHNELVTLLSPFLPMKGCSAINLTCPIFTSNRGSTFHYWEGRFGLMRALDSQQNPKTTAKKLVQEYIRGFASRFPNDFFARWGRTAKESEGEERLQIVEYCREAFDATTSYFEQHRYDQIVSAVKHDKPRTRYMQLVAAHTTMSANAISEVLRKLKEERDVHGYRSQPEQQVKYNLEPDSYGYFVEENYLYALDYADRVHHRDHGVIKFVQDEGVRSSALDIEDAWWMLMLRGIAWDLAMLDGGKVDPPVPSSVYYNKTPVWII